MHDYHEVFSLASPTPRFVRESICLDRLVQEVQAFVTLYIIRSLETR